MTPPPRSFARWAGWLAPVLCALVPMAVFFPALAGGFLIWDDNINLLHNPALWQDGGQWAWMWGDWESVQRYKPLNWTMWRLMGDAFGLNPVVFHAANLVLHAVNAVLLYRVGLAVIAGGEGLRAAPVGWARLAALVGALTWALHPLRVEPVAWISGAGYPLATLWALASVVLFQRHLRQGGAASRWGALACFGMSLLSYPAAAALPALLLVLFALQAGSGWERWPTAAEARRVVILLAPYAVAATLLLGLTLWTRLQAGGGDWHRPTSLAEVGWGTRVMHALAVWGWYGEKTLLPVALAPVYVELREFSGGSLRAVGGLVLLVLAGGLAWRLRSVWPELGLLGVAGLLLAVPVLGVTDLPFTPSDRYTYVPGSAWALMVTTGVARWGTRLSPRMRPAAAGLAVVLLAVVAGLSVRQLEHWATPEAFFRHAQARIAPHPATADLHWRLGLHYLMMEDAGAARREFERVLQYQPGHADAARYLRVLSERPGATPATP